MNIKSWTPEKIEFLKSNFNILSEIELCNILDISRYSIYRKAKELTLIRKKATRKYKDIIKNNYKRIGVYFIINDTTGIFYIGSSNDMGTRIRTHITKLDKNKHANKRLQEDWNNGYIFSIKIYKELYTTKEACELESELIKNHINIYNKSKEVDYLTILNNEYPKELLEIKQEDDCILWTCLAKNGYGIIRKRYKGKQYTLSAHKVVWVLYNKKNVPSNLRLCHKCDNRNCINVNHLFLGTDEDNAKDRQFKNRGIKSKYRNKILEFKKEGLTNTEISKKLNICYNTVWMNK